MALRAMFVLLSVLSGLGIGLSVGGPNAVSLLLGAGIGVIFSGAVIWLERTLQRVSFSVTVGGVLGFAVGILLAGLLALVGSQVLNHNTTLFYLGSVALLLGFPYLGLMLGARFGKEGLWSLSATPSNAPGRENTCKLLDTSVIIDGRIADLCQTGFIEGALVVPQFILQELQYISDSSDSLKRARGRRGLDVLNTIQKMVDIDVRIVEDDFPNIKEVDAKLVELGKKLGAKILTNDLNLNKVAELQGVRVLNINELCNALKPVVLPGETIRVFVLKEGKEAGQGVAYLDDGTMIVVDNAKRCIGKNVDVVVTSVLQTSAGRMIFTRLKEETEREELSFARG